MHDAHGNQAIKLAISTLVGLVVATALTPAVAGSPAQEGCTSPSEGIEICDTDGDPRPEEVRVEVQDEHAGTVAAVYEERTTGTWHLRSVEVLVDPSEGGAAVDAGTRLSISCVDDPIHPGPCNEGRSEVSIGERDSETPYVGVDADCQASPWVPTLCRQLHHEGKVATDDGNASSSTDCGEGWTTPCPEHVRQNTTVEHAGGEEHIEADVTVASASVCLHASQENSGCVRSP